MNLENLEHGFCLERTKLTLLKNGLSKFSFIERNTGFFEHDFLRFVVWPFSKSQLQSQIHLALVEIWKCLFLLINWLETI